MAQTSFVSITDQFCGAGGSSIGAEDAGGELICAMNHWQRAIETHATNFPKALHDCADLSAVDPRRYPSTTILLTSPECTNHTLAKGQKKFQRAAVGARSMFEGFGLDPAGERSRATMWDVVRFAEYHRYAIVIVENVIEARDWEMWESWWHAMTVSLRYEGQVVYYNSQFAWPTPQSRDRMYVVFWRRGNRAPDLAFYPPAWCPACKCNVASVQSWKQPKRPWGRYDRQYVYCCPICATIVRPYYYCAANAVDWGIPTPRIGDRRQPLKPKTIARIEAGLKKFSGQGFVIMTNQTVIAANMRALGDALPTQTTGTVPALTMPFLASMEQSGSNGDRVYPLTAPTPTQTTAQATGIVLPPGAAWLVPFTGDHAARPATGVWPTQTAGLNIGLLVETKYSHARNDRTRAADQPWPAQTGEQSQALVTAPFLVRLTGQAGESNGLLPPTSPLGTQVAASSQHALVTSPFLLDLHGTGTVRGVDNALGTVSAGGNHHAVCAPAPFLLNYQGAARGLNAPLITTTTVDRTAVVAPDGTPTVAECGFRILSPPEVGAAMAFPAAYVVLGTQREKVKQYGNAVTPPVMRMLLERCLATL